MRRKLPLMLGATFLAFAVAACEGPIGPKGDQGETGETGATGAQGPAGVDGTNALNTCSDCHSSDATIVAIEQQFALSPHGFGNYEVRPDMYGSDCGTCHSHQGFVAAAAGTTPDWTNGVASMNCRTCHQIHTTYEGADFALTTTDAVTLRVGGNEVDFGTVEASANLCATCHQARTEDQWPRSDSDSTFTLGGHFDMHHGPQASLYSTEIPAELDFGTTPPGKFPSHEVLACTGCHMGTADTLAALGLTVEPVPDGELFHTFRPSSDVCGSCHGVPSAADSLPQFDYGDVQTDTEAAMDQLETCLVAEGLLTCDASGCDRVEGDYRESFVAAFVVWEAVHEDGSHGVHAPKWMPDWAAAAADHMKATSTDATCTGQPAL